MVAMVAYEECRLVVGKTSGISWQSFREPSADPVARHLITPGHWGSAIKLAANSAVRVCTLAPGAMHKASPVPLNMILWSTANL